MEETFTFENLLQAAKECAKGVKWKNSVIKWDANILNYCLRLEQDLASGRFRWSDYIIMQITSPKPRTVNSLRFRDRVVQRCMCNTGLYDDLTRGNVYDNGACQKGKGTKFARNRLKCMMQRHFRQFEDKGWVLSLDIHSFFNSIPHDRLIQMVYRRVRNPRYRQMVAQVIRSFSTPESPGKGIGLGSQISQLLAVAYLSPVDYFAKMMARIDGYIRYCDNIIILIPDKITGPDGQTRDGKIIAQNVRNAIVRILTDLGLELNPKSTLFPLDKGINFLGFHYQLKKTGGVSVIPLKSSFRRERRKLGRMIKKMKGGDTTIKPQDVWNSFVSWKGYFQDSDAYNRIHKMELELRRKMQ